MHRAGAASSAQGSGGAARIEPLRPCQRDHVRLLGPGHLRHVLGCGTAAQFQPGAGQCAVAGQELLLPRLAAWAAGPRISGRSRRRRRAGPQVRCRHGRTAPRPRRWQPLTGPSRPAAAARAGSAAVAAGPRRARARPAGRSLRHGLPQWPRHLIAGQDTGHRAGLVQRPDHLPGRTPRAKIARQRNSLTWPPAEPGDNFRRLGHRLLVTMAQYGQDLGRACCLYRGHLGLLSQPPGRWRCPSPCAAPHRPALPPAGRRPISRSGHG